MGIADVSGLPEVPGYQVLRRIARGGMGDVYEALRVGPGGFQKRVALKQLASDRAVSGRARARFLEEARLSAQLDHPNVVRVHDVVATGSAELIVMELLRGADLVQVIEAGGALPWASALAVMAQALDGLAYAHALADDAGRPLGLVHRDLAPRNLMLCHGGTVKILDFGIAKQVDGPSLTRSGQIHGTVEFLSPEQARGERVDARSDLYQLGATIYWAISGRFPHSGGPAGEVIARIATASPPPLDDVPPAVAALLARAMAKDPAARFADAAAMATAVREALGDVPGGTGVIAALLAGLPAPGEGARAGTISETGEHTAEAPRSPVATPAVTAPSRPRRWPLVVAGGAIAVAAVAGHALGTRRTTSSPTTPVVAPSVEWSRLTSRSGIIGNALFAPDGSSIVYAASWDGRPFAITTSLPGNPHGRALGIDDADVLAISPQGELLLQLRPHGHYMRHTGTLARVPLAGGEPREELTDVQAADYSPDGQRVALIRVTQDRSWVEFPIGTTLLESAFGWYDNVQVAPSGDRLALVEHPVREDDQGYVALVGLDGRLTRLGPRWSSIAGLAWAPGGDEVWFTASNEGAERQLHAVSLTGAVRALASLPTDVRLTDVRADGAVLVSRELVRKVAYGDLDGDGSVELVPTYAGMVGFELSPDGRWQLAVDDSGALTGGTYGVYLIPTAGGGAVRIGDGLPRGFSRDGRTVLAISQDRRLARLLPVGPGAPRDLDLGALHDLDGGAPWLPDGEHFVVTATGADGIARLWLCSIHGDAPIAFADGYTMDRVLGQMVRPDGSTILLRDASGRPTLVPFDGGPPRPLPTLLPGEQYLQWTADGTALIAGPAPLDSAYPMVVSELHVVDVASGERRPWRQLEAPTEAVTSAPMLMYLSPDSTRYIFGVYSLPGTLYQVEGLR